MSAVADKLREARALIEGGWTRGAFARDKSGRQVFEHGKSAARWCPLGALHVSTRGEPFAVYRVVHATLRVAVGVEYVPDWNDAPERTKSEVLAAFDKAIELAARGETL